MKSKTELKPSEKPDIERVIEETDLLNRKKQIWIWPIRVDTMYVVLRSTNKSPHKIDHAYERLEDYFYSLGFKKKNKPESDIWQNEYGLTIFWGKLNQFDKNKALKFQLTGTYLIYKDSEKIARDIILKSRKILSKNKVLTTYKITRLDPSILVAASDLYQIVPNKKDLILMGNNMKSKTHQYDDSSEDSAVKYWNSKVELLVYDKGYDLFEQDRTADYIEYILPFLQEAKRMNLRLYRLELRVKNRAMIFECYEKKYFSKKWDEDLNRKGLMELFERFFESHQFRKVPDNQKDKTDKRNRGRWPVDPITKNLFLGGKSKKMKSKKKKKFTFHSDYPKKVKNIDDSIKRFSNDLAFINPNFSLEDIEMIFRDVIVEFQKKRYTQKTNVLDSIQRQTAFMLSFARSKYEIDLIKREREQLLKDHKLRSSAQNRYAISDMERQARRRLLSKDQDDDETS